MDGGGLAGVSAAKTMLENRGRMCSWTDFRFMEYMDPQGISLFNHGKTHFPQLENLLGQFPFQFPDRL